jgi:activating signal cointegrator complex subunit 3
MNSMNKPTYAAITTHSPFKPVLIFVSSRRQTRLTALDLIQYAAADERPRQFLNMTEEEMEMITSQVIDENLKHTLQFGIGLHHAGLNDRDRSLVEELFTNTKIQILVCTSTLAWGVNLPAHLVVIKGTEFYDGKSKRYVDFPITDVLQMMGRAGRPQFDQHGKAVILVHEPKKSFYKKFLYEPFPVESSLAQHLHDHLNAEVAAGTIASKQDAIDYLTWTYLFRRLVMNPSYYDLEETSSAAINLFLSSLVNSTLQALEDAGCVRVNEDNTVEPLVMGTVASQYYLSYATVSLFSSNIRADTSLEALLHVLCGAAEYDELPVRHNEVCLNFRSSPLNFS